MLEAIGHRLGGVVDPDIDLVDAVRSMPCVKASPLYWMKLDLRVIHLRGVASLGQGDPDLSGSCVVSPWNCGAVSRQKDAPP